MIKCHLSIWIRHMIRVSLNLHCRHVIVLFLDDREKVFVLWLLSSGRNPNCWRKCCWRKVVEWLDIFTANITQFSLQILGKFALWPFKLIQIGQKSFTHLTFSLNFARCMKIVIAQVLFTHHCKKALIVMKVLSYVA